MAQISTRKVKADELLKRLSRGPAESIRTGQSEESWEAVKKRNQEFMLWIRSWIVPDVLQLVPELKGIKLQADGTIANPAERVVHILRIKEPKIAVDDFIITDGFRIIRERAASVREASAIWAREFGRPGKQKTYKGKFTEDGAAAEVEQIFKDQPPPEDCRAMNKPIQYCCCLKCEKIRKHRTANSRRLYGDLSK